ncbi:hypothetical protein JR316_0012574 [Psilocybe cubensis]|uniref:DUF4100 domain-containing protein n=2 Tax=Psilocybe cubensis TaxID=181762 RepID=A0A8H8CGD1_PSICU|nr:hypothetical protein JR316_0012574 [Psilocybe cubensis]KAH9475463.1 hypothetical protein JR316_0012574 [Psilocybe cubensis]
MDEVLVASHTIAAQPLVVTSDLGASGSLLLLVKKTRETLSHPQTPLIAVLQLLLLVYSFFVCSTHLGRRWHIIFGAHREGVSNIEPSTSRSLRQLPSRTLRQELVAAFQNPENLSDESLFIEVPENQATHSYLPSPTSPLFSPSELPSPISGSFEFPTTTHSHISPFILTPSPTSNTLQLPLQQFMPQPEAATMSPHMPARGDRSAPSFDPTKPRELCRYFSDLEFLFSISNVTDDTEQKKHAVRYVSLDVADIWETLPEFTNPLKNYQSFKAAVMDLYPDANDAYRYTMSDMDLLIGNRQRLGIHTLSDLAEYHSQYMAVTNFLCSKSKLSTLEQKRGYVRAFQPALWAKISQRLQLKKPDHYPDEPYDIIDVQTAAKFVLHGTHTASALAIPSSTPTASIPDVSIKPEQLGSIFTEFTKSIIEALNSTQNRSRSTEPTTQSGIREVKCNFCGKDHYIRNCDLVEEYRRAGKLKRNTEGKIVLPSGAFIPRDIPGTLMKERINEWHRRNPNQLATATLSASTLFGAVSSVQTPLESLSARQTIQLTYHLTADDRITLLEAELFNLRAKRPGFTPIIRTRAQKERAPVAEEDREISPPRDSEAPKPSTSTPDTSSQPPMVQNNDITAPRATTDDPQTEHPFRNALDAVYMPPQSRNVAALPKPAPKKNEPAYRTFPPIYDSDVANTVYNRSLEAPVTITQRELLSIAPEIRSQYRDSTTSKRSANTDKIAQTNLLENRADPTSNTVVFNASTVHPLPSSQHRSPPEGSTVIDDPFDIYYRSLRPGQHPDPNKIIVAKESSALRSIYPIVDNSLKVECILDPGCQIIAMSEDVCHSLSLIYDPTIKLNMQSANGTVDQSLGLA